ncbi:MAG: M15 family metallopeptidase [Lachnospiraceae bacterium]|nr:M15 family metallopeptidase [Lachnospiraceae bacterium]
MRIITRKRLNFIWMTAALALLLCACEKGPGKTGPDIQSTDYAVSAEPISTPDAQTPKAKEEGVWYALEALNFALELPKSLTVQEKDAADRNAVLLAYNDAMTVELLRWDQVSDPNLEALAALVSKVTEQKTTITSVGDLSFVKVEWPHGDMNYYFLAEGGDAYVLWITPYVMKDPEVYWKVKAIEESFCTPASLAGKSVDSVPAIEEKEIDRFILVDKKHSLPEDWEENLDLVCVVNSVGDTVWAERKAYKAYLELKKDLWESEGIDVDLDSAYRSVAYQQEILERFTEKYGAAYAKRTVATPGTSEHHTGLAFDLYFRLDGEEVYENEDLVKYPEIWKRIHTHLAQHGFFLRYPGRSDGTVDYTYEPWHIRYVGVEAATELMSDLSRSFEDWLER